MIVYLIDTLRADHLGCYGYKKPTSPNIDRFAKEATLFRTAIAQSSWTRPSVASIFTGLSPLSHGTHTPDDALPAETATLAEMLSAADYRTAAFITNITVGVRNNPLGFEQGFSSVDYLNEPIVMSNKVNDKVFPWLKKRAPETLLSVYPYHGSAQSL